ncbi:MAG: hypothetical protein JETCAE01_06800 [Anaerolineaceae bacterium]|nr:MAG: hypothetical protein JETCAE01_06800 [Anaerolineaceae bacterium]
MDIDPILYPYCMFWGFVIFILPVIMIFWRPWRSFWMLLIGSFLIFVDLYPAVIYPFIKWEDEIEALACIGATVVLYGVIEFIYELSDWLRYRR